MGFYNNPELKSLVDIEVANYCNAKCVMCTTNKIERQKGFMDSKTFYKIADDCLENNISAVMFCGLGEPLLHPLIYDFISYISENNGETYLRTNASLLTNENVRKLLDANIKTVSISFNGISKDTYEKVMVGLNFEKALHNVEYFISAANKQKMEIFINATITKLNEDEVDLIEPFWKEKGIELIELVKCHSRGGTMCDVNVYDYIEPERSDRCDIFSIIHFITWSGDVLACCHDMKGTTLLGNLLRTSLIEMKYKKEEISKKKNWFPICKKCDDNLRYCFKEALVAHNIRRMKKQKCSIIDNY